jgi:hypothetical protein
MNICYGLATARKGLIFSPVAYNIFLHEYYGWYSNYGRLKNMKSQPDI